MSAKKKSRVFRMKQFDVCDARSANKVGVDGVLVGSWVSAKLSTVNILDVGCGCGIISLMMAQRHPSADIYGIDIDENAIAEASENGAKSPWGERLHFYKYDFSDLSTDKKCDTLPHKFDLIISNPPYFESGTDPSVSMRMTARHSGSLSPFVLIHEGGKLLNNDGLLVFIAPYIYAERYEKEADVAGWTLLRKCIVQGRKELQPKRVIYEFAQSINAIDLKSVGVTEQLIIEESPGVYTQEYIKLGSPFYLKF